MKKFLLTSLLLLAASIVFATSNTESSVEEGGVITLSMWDIMVTEDEEKGAEK